MRAQTSAVIECAHAAGRGDAAPAAPAVADHAPTVPEKMATYGELNLGLAGAIDLCNLPHSTHMCRHSHFIFTYTFDKSHSQSMLHCD